MIRIALLALALFLPACDGSALGNVDDVASESLALVSTSTLEPPAMTCEAHFPSAPEMGLPASCGIWIGIDEADADARSRRTGFPDGEIRTQGYSSCSDAIAIAAQRWPGRSVVRYTVYRIDVRSAQAPPP